MDYKDMFEDLLDSNLQFPSFHELNMDQSYLIDFNQIEEFAPISQNDNSDSFLMPESTQETKEESNPSDSSDQRIIEEQTQSYSQQSEKTQKKRTSNTSLKPIFTCTKHILLRLDDSFGGFFKFFMKKNQNSVKKEYFEQFISFAEVRRISLKGSETNINQVFDMYRNQYDKLAKKQRNKGQVQRAEETEKFVELFYEALKHDDYKKRMQILFGGRKHDLSSIELRRKQFKEFKPKKK